MAKIDIVDVISSYIELKRVGNNYTARCPFHPDDTPSFYVSPSKGIFKCFGCGVGGDAVKFVSLYENVDYWTALQRLAERYRIPIRIEKGGKEDKLFTALRRVAEFYHEELKSSRQALDYLQSRGISMKTALKFMLGYGGDTSALVELLKREGLLEVYERTANITGVEKGIYRDLFKGRLIVPIRDMSGRVVAFGGRSLDGSSPKYINSPESEVFKKGKSLFGLYEAKDYIRESGEVLLVEGYFDLISLWQEGFRNVLAPLGTALTQEQAQLISKLAKRVILLYDGDKAGRKAVRSAVPHLLMAGLEVRVVYLPEGEDPDTFVRKNPAELKRLIATALPVQQELIKRIKEGDTSCMEELLYYAGFIKDSVERFQILKELSHITHIPLSSLNERVPKVEPRREKQEQSLSYHEVLLLAGLYRFGFEEVKLEELRLSPYALELVEAIQRGEYHLLPDYIKNYRTYDLERAFRESIRALSLHEEELPRNFQELRLKSKERPRKLRKR